ncbi:MAG: fibronectin type III domain-containing protein [Treponema sp.]|nr:fibronectin type III domain-containing protein [Treponema sp.]
MRKTWYALIAVLFLFSSCQEDFVSIPFIPDGGAQGGGTTTGTMGVPENVLATHGEKRNITLSWNPVPNAALYYIYRANSPLDNFIRCAETDLNQFTLTVLPGSSIYYSVSSVSLTGIESARSNFIMGTSLAQPVISDITDISESGASVTWYMENVSSNTYKNNLLYTVYCFNGGTEVAQIVLDAAEILENRAVFSDLNANTRYEYQVEAYLRSDQSNSEKSDKMDAATARRFRPGPPLELRAARGTAVNKIEVSFELPDIVDIALGENRFDPKPLYFTISKRLYSESGNNEYQLVCQYFGTITENAAGKAGGKTFDSIYMPGDVVTWEDTNVIRGVLYEYLVQSYVDDVPRIISSDASRVSATGWSLGEGELSYGKPVYTLGGALYEDAKLPLVFEFDDKDIIYTYTVVAKVEPLGDENDNEPDAEFEIKSEPLSYPEAAEYVLRMDLSGKSTETNPGRGIYSVEIEIGLPGGNIIYTFKALGSVQISEDTQPIVVENFHIQDGYTDRFVLIWDNYANRKYDIYQSENGTDWNWIGSENNDPNDEDENVILNYTYTVSGQSSGIVRYFRIRPSRPVNDGDFKAGQLVFAPAARTLGIPVLSLGGGTSYSVITPTWTDAQKADTYRIKYRYTGDTNFTTAAEVKKNELSVDANGRFRYAFNPEGFNDAAKSGKEIQIEVDALNEGLREIIGGGEIATSSQEDIRTKLVGPAELKLTVSKAAFATEIDISWDHVYGAGGYYIFRRQFNMNNSAEEGTEAVVYYVPASSSANITGKNLETDASNARADTTTVKAAITFASSRYKLMDRFLTDAEYESPAYSRHSLAYRNQQNNMAQGMSYRYFVVPVIVRDNVPEPLASIEFNYAEDGNRKNTNITSYTIRENGTDIQYSGAAVFEQDGFTIGFGQNVVATKGTYSSSGNVNNGIRVTWDPPPRLSGVAGFTPRYTVYRKETNSSLWVPVTTVDNREYIETSVDLRGKALEYIVGISNAGASFTQPQHSRRFIELCGSMRDEKSRPLMLGYMLDMVRMFSVSRGESADLNSRFAELVTWYSGGIINSYDSNSGDANWGIDGYEIFVMNRNIDAGWHSIHDRSYNDSLKQVYQSVEFTPNNTRSVANAVGINRNLLYVWRDYKHFFKVRSYVMHDNEKVYCPDPAWTYQYRWGTTEAAHIAASNQMENDYVKWGARQVTAREFAIIATLYVARGVERRRSSWASTLSWGSANASSNMGGSGSVSDRSDAGVTNRSWRYRNYKDDLQAITGDWMTFLTVDGNMWMGTRASGWPNSYGRGTFETYREERLWITGPWDTPGLYNGAIHYGGQPLNRNISRTSSNGEIYVIYPSGTAQQTVVVHGENDTPLAWDYGSVTNGRHRLGENPWR